MKNGHCKRGIKEKISVKSAHSTMTKKYDSIEHCLSDDDIGATAIAFDGTNVWLNERSKFAILNLTVMVDPKMLTSLARRRLEKYFHKGFDIALPELDVSKLPTHYLKLSLCDAAELPGLIFAYNEIKGNKIFVERFILPEEEEKKEEEEKANVGGGSYNQCQGEGKSEITVRAENIQKLCTDKEKFSVFAEGDYLLNVLNVWPGITSRQLNNFYQSFKKQMVQDSKFNFAIAKQYFVMYPVAEIANKLFTAKDLDEALEALTQEHIERAEKKLQEWLKKDCTKGQQVAIQRKGEDCEVFPRLYKENKEFYGRFFKA